VWERLRSIVEPPAGIPQAVSTQDGLHAVLTMHEQTAIDLAIALAERPQRLLGMPWRRRLRLVTRGVERLVGHGAVSVIRHGLQFLAR
jgi:hypothetical protein